MTSGAPAHRADDRDTLGWLRDRAEITDGVLAARAHALAGLRTQHLSTNHLVTADGWRIARIEQRVVGSRGNPDIHGGLRR